MTLHRRLQLLVGGIGLVLVVVIATLGVAVARFRDDVNRREELIPATADAAELSHLAIDALADIDRPSDGEDRAAEFRDTRQRADVLVGRLQRELARRPELGTSLEALRAELLAYEAAVTTNALSTGTKPGAMPSPDVAQARAALTSLVERADGLTNDIARAVRSVAEHARTSREEFIWTVAAAVAIALALLAVGAGTLLRWVVLPVRLLAEDVATVAEGAYDLPLRSEGGRELAQLADSVGRMRDRILAERDRSVRAIEAVDQNAPAVAALRTLLAPRLAEPPEGLTTAGRLLPAEGVLAGDWFDLAARGSSCVVAIGDVCGHGVEAGVLAVRTKFALLDAIELGLEPHAALELASQRFGRDDTFVTALLAVIDPVAGRCRYASAGHNPALVLHTDGTFEHLHRTGPLIGLANGPRPTAEVAIGPGDLFVAYTDGVVEARDDGGEQLALEGLEAVVLEHRDGDPDRIAEAIVGHVLTHCGGRCADDATVTVVRVANGGSEG